MMDSLLFRQNVVFQNFDFFPLRLKFTGAPLGLLDLPNELQLRIYRFVFGSYDIELRKVLKAKTKSTGSSQAVSLNKQMVDYFKFIYKDKYLRNGILCVCKAITPVAIESRQRGYSGTLEVRLRPEQHLDFLFGIHRSTLAKSQSYIFQKTRKLSLPDRCSEPEISKALNDIQSLKAIEIRQELPDEETALLPFARQIGMNIGESLVDQYFTEKLTACFEKGDLDWYCNEKNAHNVTVMQELLQSLASSSHGQVQLFLKTTFRFAPSTSHFAISLVGYTLSIWEDVC